MPSFDPSSDTEYVPGDPSTPPEVTPTGWTPNMQVARAADGVSVVFSFTEPAGWSRYPWHIATGGTYVPAGRVADLRTTPYVTAGGAATFQPSLAWHGAGPLLWRLRVDGTLHDLGWAPLGPGERFSAVLPSGLADWSQPHSVAVSLLYEDVPAYQWWERVKPFPIAVDPPGKSLYPVWLYPGAQILDVNYPPGYPADAPDYTDFAPYSSRPADGFPANYRGSQPILPPGLTAADYGAGQGTFAHATTVYNGNPYVDATTYEHRAQAGVRLTVESQAANLALPIPVTVTAPPTLTPTPTSTPTPTPTPSTPAPATTTTPVGTPEVFQPFVAVTSGSSSTTTNTATTNAELSGGVLTHAQLEQAWILAGGSPALADTAAAIAQAESSGDTTKIHNTAYPQLPGYKPPLPGNLPEYSVGLWQINEYSHKQYTTAQLLTPVGNANAAVAIERVRGNFSDWSTFTGGEYSAYLTSAGTPTPTPGPTSTATGTVRAARAFSGWQDLRNSVNHHLPKQLERSRQTGEATLRLLVHRRKVGR